MKSPLFWGKFPRLMSLEIHHYQPIDLFNTLIGVMVILSIACNSITEIGWASNNASALPPDNATESLSSWYTVYFTDPGSSNSKTLRGGPDKALANAIRAARVSVDMAVLQLDLWSIRDALINAHRRGLAVRMVTDSDYIEEKEIQDLIEAGIPVTGDRREGLMHDKFVVIDRQEVWTGSMNFTINDAYRNHNNLIRIRSTELAENYTTEFEEMFLDDLFGVGSPANTPHPSLNIQGETLENCFSPDDGCLSRLIELIEGAQRRIDFLAFSFTSDDLANAMLERAEVGVSISGIFDESQYYSNSGTEFDRFRSAGLDVHLDANPRTMHNKVIIIDEKIVITGSYNFTQYAETRNDENVLIVHNPEIASLYLEEFHKIFDETGE